MSKAFTRESDDASADSPELARPASVLPPGAKNYVTPSGARHLRAELQALIELRQTRADASTESGGAPKTDPVSGQRIRFHLQSLESAVIVDPPAPPWTHVRFGATVRVRETSGDETHYRIVGADEADFDRGWISWFSPLARALLNTQVGQTVRFKVPSGERELEIVEVAYE